MKILYLDCSMGASGDMLSSALYELIDDKKAFMDKMNSAGIPNTVITAEKAVKCGISGIHLNVSVNGEEEGEHRSSSHHSAHRSLADIEAIIHALNLSDYIKKDILSIYKMIAQAESKVHDTDVSEIHFHELGALDAIADITMFCLLKDMLGADKIIASPVNTGKGQVRCAHGIVPVPAPATAEILQGIPIYSNDVDGELCTPTGAALLKYFVNEFNNMPMMLPLKAGYGMGKKDFEAANCIRAILGESTDDVHTDCVYTLSCNLDDMTPEAIAFAAEIFMESGALDVYTSPIVMKKGRLATMLSVLCTPEDKDNMVKLIFKHTSTLGIRESFERRYVLSRTVEAVSTPYGNVRIKKSTGYGALKQKCEYEDAARIARENNLSIEDVTKQF